MQADQLLIFSAFIFVGMWFATTYLIGLISGWYKLAQTYPDRTSKVLRSITDSGAFNGIGFKNVLKFEACADGLRLSVMRIFAPFSQPFLVPWGELTVLRNSTTVDLKFTRAQKVRLVLSVKTANKLAVAAGAAWPEINTPAPAPE